MCKKTGIDVISTHLHQFEFDTTKCDLSSYFRAEPLPGKSLQYSNTRRMSRSRSATRQSSSPQKHLSMRRLQWSRQSTNTGSPETPRNSSFSPQVQERSTSSRFRQNTNLKKNRVAVADLLNCCDNIVTRDPSLYTHVLRLPVPLTWGDVYMPRYSIVIGGHLPYHAFPNSTSNDADAAYRQYCDNIPSLKAFKPDKVLGNTQKMYNNRDFISEETPRTKALRYLDKKVIHDTKTNDHLPQTANQLRFTNCDDGINVHDSERDILEMQPDKKIFSTDIINPSLAILRIKSDKKKASREIMNTSLSHHYVKTYLTEVPSTDHFQPLTLDSHQNCQAVTMASFTEEIEHANLKESLNPLELLMYDTCQSKPKQAVTLEERENANIKENLKTLESSMNESEYNHKRSKIKRKQKYVSSDTLGDFQSHSCTGGLDNPLSTASQIIQESSNFAKHHDGKYHRNQLKEKSKKGEHKSKRGKGNTKRQADASSQLLLKTRTFSDVRRSLVKNQPIPITCILICRRKPDRRMNTKWLSTVPKETTMPLYSAQESACKQAQWVDIPFTRNPLQIPKPKATVRSKSAPPYFGRFMLFE